MNKVILWDYPKSSASYRVRIALGLADIPYQSMAVDLTEGMQRGQEHLRRNPQGLVPVLDIDGVRLTQSLAIIEYLDATRGLGLLPKEPVRQAKVRALAYALAVDLHPVCNLSVMKHATGGQEPARSAWMSHFIRPALLAFERMLAEFDPSPFCIGNQPSLPDLCLIPQLYNARRWDVAYADCRRISAIETACRSTEAFKSAAPQNWER